MRGLVSLSYSGRRSTPRGPIYQDEELQKLIIGDSQKVQSLESEGLLLPTFTIFSFLKETIARR